jgi:chromosome segregation ATPase
MNFDIIAGIVGGAVGGGSLGAVVTRILDRRKVHAEARKIEAEREETLSEGYERFVNSVQSIYQSQLEKLEDRVSTLEQECDARDRQYNEALQRLIEHDQSVIEANTKILRQVHEQMQLLTDGVSRIETNICEWRNDENEH